MRFNKLDSRNWQTKDGKYTIELSPTTGSYYRIYCGIERISFAPSLKEAKREAREHEAELVRLGEWGPAK